MNKYANLKNLILFLGIAFLLPLISLFLRLNTENRYISFLLYGIEAASPSIAAIVVLRIGNNANGYIKDIFNTGHLIKAVILPLIIAAFTMFLTKGIFCALYKRAFSFGDITLYRFIIILWSFVAEELGWRGYLLPVLKSRLKHIWAAPLVVGVIWCLWHYHYFLFNEIQIPFVLFFTGCVIESYIYDYLLRRTEGNLVSAMTYHFSWNLFLHIFGINPGDNKGSLMPYAILIALELLILTVILLFPRIIKHCRKNQDGERITSKI